MRDRAAHDTPSRVTRRTEKITTVKETLDMFLVKNEDGYLWLKLLKCRQIIVKGCMYVYIEENKSYSRISKLGDHNIHTR